LAKIRLRGISAFDVDQLTHLSKELGWRESDWFNLFDDKHLGVAAEKSDETIIGYLVMRARKKELHLETVLVAPGHRRKRLGTMLFNHALLLDRLEDFPPATVYRACPREDQLGACLWLKSLGFVATGMARRAYEDADGINFVREL
jgi:ribosomal protein S18 acetylase RimI-like enzyme